MSVLINSTSITIKNSTNYLIEITCQADQDESFHVKSVGDVIYEREQSNNIIGTLFELMYGSKLKKVTINLKPKTETQLTINSKSELEFCFEAKVKHSTDHLPGSLPISTEYQGMKLHVNMIEERGIVKDKRGNVAIVGTTVPEKQEIIIRTEIKDSTNKKVFIDDYNPAFCSISMSNTL